MKVLYKLNNELRLIETKKAIRVIDKDLVFRDGKYYCLATLPTGFTETDVRHLLATCTIDLIKYGLEVHRFLKEDLERTVDIAMIDYIINNVTRFVTRMDSSENESLIRCRNGDVEEMIDWDYPDNLAKEIDAELGVNEFTEIVKNSLWYKIVRKRK